MKDLGKNLCYITSAPSNPTTKGTLPGMSHYHWYNPGLRCRIVHDFEPLPAQTFLQNNPLEHLKCCNTMPLTPEIALNPAFPFCS